MSTVFVTGNVGVIPGTPHAEYVRQCFETANKTERDTTIYVLGSLFAHEAHKEDMIVYLDRLPGIKVLLPGKKTRLIETTLPGWADTAWYKEVKEWSMEFWLTADVYPPVSRLVIHACPEWGPDTGRQINADWHEWTDRFGPGGLNSLYSLGVLAQQYAAGVIANEPA